MSLPLFFSSFGFWWIPSKIFWSSWSNHVCIYWKWAFFFTKSCQNYEHPPHNFQNLYFQSDFSASKINRIFLIFFMENLIKKSVAESIANASLRPESSENIPILFQGADLYFSNQNDLRNPKMGSKQSVVVPPYYWFFQKTVFGQKKC